jgi:hypothetical protein
MREEAKAEAVAEVVDEVLISGRAAADAGETLEEWLDRMEGARAKGN